MRNLNTVAILTLVVLAVSGCVRSAGCRSTVSALVANGAYVSPSLTLRQIKQRELNRTIPVDATVYVVGNPGAKPLTKAQLERQQTDAARSLVQKLKAMVKPGDTVHFVSTVPEFGGPVARGQDGFVVVRKGCILRSLATIEY